MGKNIAVFADGTGNTIGKHDSNVLRLCRMANLLDQKQQLVIYDPGVGTRTPLEELKRAFPEAGSVVLIEDSFEPSWVRMYAVWLLGLGFGYGTERNIKQLYGELVKRYDPGDQVYIFGFSRGAFTARSLAGLIYRCGLLRCDHTDKQCDHADKIEQAYNLYRTHFERRKARGSCEN